MQTKRTNTRLRSFLKKIIDTGIFVLVVLILTYGTVRYVAQRTVVHNISMQETLSEGDNLITEKLSYHFREPKRFEIICFRCQGVKDDLIKRVIGLPGETVQIRGGVIYIDKAPLKEPLELEKVNYAGCAEHEMVLGDDEYFVLGDNRDESMDSRYSEVGNVKRNMIVGRSAFRIYPFHKFGTIK